MKLLLNSGTRGIAKGDESSLRMVGLRTVRLENITLPTGLIRCLLNGRGVEKLVLDGIDLVEDEVGELFSPEDRGQEEPNAGESGSTSRPMKKLLRLHLLNEQLEDFADYLFSMKLMDKLLHVQHLHLTAWKTRNQDVLAKIIG